MGDYQYLSQYSIDRKSYIPIYIQLRDIVHEIIENRNIKDNARLPSENVLSTAFNISRMTVRRAIQELVREGYLYIKRGEGTFINRAPKTQMLFKLDGFSAEVAKMGYHSHSKVLEVIQVIDFEKYEAAYGSLHVKHKKPVIMIKRVRYLENIPVALETSFLKAEIGKPLLERKQDESLSIYSYIENELGIILSQAEHILEPGIANKDIADKLEIKPGVPILTVKGTTYSNNGIPIEYLEGIYRGDKYKLKVKITR